MKILLPVDGSDTSSRAVQYVIKQAQNSKVAPELHLLNVQHALPGTIKGVADQAKQYHHDEGIKALAAMSDKGFLQALKAVPPIKTGRPKKA